MAFYRQPEFDNGCIVNPIPRWGYLTFLLLVYYDVPVLVPIAMYPLLCKAFTVLFHLPRVDAPDNQHIRLLRANISVLQRCVLHATGSHRNAV